jgi:ATP-dependent helicase HrpB
LLRDLGALDAEGALTPLGERMTRLPLHPRFARALVEAERRGVVDAVSDAVAIASERGDIRRRRAATAPDSNLWHQVELLEQAREARFERRVLERLGLDTGATRSVDRASRQLRKACRRSAADGSAAEGGDEDAGIALLSGLPDRVVHRRGTSRDGRVMVAIAGGGQAQLDDDSALGPEGFALALDARERANQAASVRTAVPIDATWLIELYGDTIEERDERRYDAERQRVVRLSELRYRGLQLSSERLTPAADEHCSALLAQAAVERPLRELDPSLEGWLTRARHAASAREELPRFDEAWLCRELAELAHGMTRMQELRAAAPRQSLHALLDPSVRKAIATLAPERVTLGGGRELTVRYSPGEPPAVASYLQDFFGMADGPTLGGAPMVLELWAPNGRPVQITSDLAGFWTRHYPTLAKQLRRRYPKHFWPDDPLSASAARLRRHVEGR